MSKTRPALSRAWRTRESDPIEKSSGRSAATKPRRRFTGGIRAASAIAAPSRRRSRTRRRRHGASTARSAAICPGNAGEPAGRLALPPVRACPAARRDSPLRPDIGPRGRSRGHFHRSHAHRRGWRWASRWGLPSDIDLDQVVAPTGTSNRSVEAATPLMPVAPAGRYRLCVADSRPTRTREAGCRPARTRADRAGRQTPPATPHWQCARPRRPGDHR